MTRKLYSLKDLIRSLLFYDKKDDRLYRRPIDTWELYQIDYRLGSRLRRRVIEMVKE